MSLVLTHLDALPDLADPLRLLEPEPLRDLFDDAAEPDRLLDFLDPE